MHVVFSVATIYKVTKFIVSAYQFFFIVWHIQDNSYGFDENEWPSRWRIQELFYRGVSLARWENIVSQVHIREGSGCDTI